MSKTEWTYGLHAIDALLKHNPDSILQLYVQTGRQDARIQTIIDQAETLNLPIERCSRTDLNQKAGAVHQGVIALCKPVKLEKSEAFLTQHLQTLDHPPLLLILDGITDPHNLGACLRSAEAAGVDAVIVPKDKSALINATVRKVACGAAEIVPFIVVTNLARCLQSLQKQGIWVLGTAGEADQSLYQSDLKGSLALVLGSEGKGLRRLTREYCDALLSIPLSGEVSSLNVSVSAGICLFEAVRQRLPS
ncbi:23S rRNA (guanosine(2251)-2'-O)-methyltransferase RlmB [Gammaproteobacteria bacterium]|nr:23S rRNA (guanosine(2251)-2'-O)-methyltransferase RlmB [Gammaproteobacteria bacterium]